MNELLVRTPDDDMIAEMIDPFNEAVDHMVDEEDQEEEEDGFDDSLNDDFTWAIVCLLRRFNLFIALFLIFSLLLSVSLFVNVYFISFRSKLNFESIIGRNVLSIASTINEFLFVLSFAEE